LKRVREQLAIEKARNRLGKPNSACAAVDEDMPLDDSLSMAIIAHNTALRSKSNMHSVTMLQNEHVRRLEALLNQLKSFETIEDERRRLKESIAHLKEQCTSKDKFIYNARFIIKLRDAAIEAFQKKAPCKGKICAHITARFELMTISSRGL